MEDSKKAQIIIKLRKKYAWAEIPEKAAEKGVHRADGTPYDRKTLAAMKWRYESGHYDTKKVKSAAKAKATKASPKAKTKKAVPVRRSREDFYTQVITSQEFTSAEKVQILEALLAAGGEG
jgi:hypothetical protein